MRPEPHRWPDTLGRSPSRPTDKRYVFDAPDGVPVAVWADSMLTACHLLDSMGIPRLEWRMTSDTAGVLNVEVVRNV